MWDADDRAHMHTLTSPDARLSHRTRGAPFVSGLNHRATTEYGRKYGRPNHSGISRRDLGAPKFWKRFRGSATKFGGPLARCSVIFA